MSKGQQTLPEIPAQEPNLSNRITKTALEHYLKTQVRKFKAETNPHIQKIQQQEIRDIEDELRRYP